MIHILLGASPSGSLKMVLRDLDVEKKERVISFWETFSVGPIWRLHEDIGKEARFNWKKNNLTDAYNEFHEYEQNFQKTVNEITAIPEGSPIMIWISDNAHEQTGMLFVLYLLKNKNNDIFLINTTKVYGELFKKRKEKYTVLDTGEIPPEKLRFIYEQSKNEPPLSQHERENFEKEWLALANTREYTVLDTGEIPPEKLRFIYEQSKNEPPLSQHERENFEKEWLALANTREYTVLDTGEIPPEKLRFIYEQSKNEPPLSQHERENFEKEWLALANTREYTVLDTGEIPPEKLRFIYEQSKNEPPLSQHERENFEKEWLALANTREVLRIWQNRTIHSVSEDYYDLFIINRAKKLHNEMKTKDFIKSVRLIGEVLGHLDQYVGDEFLEYRLRKLIEKRAFEMEGSLEAMAFYSVKLR
ncbi:DUF1835 domain-containing protein [Aeribacillus pallidus]|uniref:DUF1835 domain-containing protein n=1 Tax=Aeribacillus pallidus TaxID=33936 RepID=UPI000E354A3E|nr:DUF1835 domain-containing protein [Aeribacillus pallidus]